MNFEHNDKTKELIARVEAFMDAHIYPAESVYAEQMEAFGEDRWQVPAVLEDLKEKAKAEGLWNLFLPESERGFGLSNVEYAPLCEIMGRVGFAAEVFNCSAPDTGNMEVLERYGNERHKKEYMEPLLEGKIRSAFLMTEPAVASSDATNIETRQLAAEYLRDGGAVIIFPAGAISLAPKLVGDAYDKEWKTFAAKLAIQPDTVTVPFLFDGQNSLLFQAARKISLTLAYSLMFREICKLMGSTVSLTMRRPIHADELKEFGNRKAVTQHLRDRTYGIL